MNNSDEKAYRIPVSWTMINDVTVKAKTLDDAIHLVEEMDDLPSDGAEYVDSSFEVNVEDARILADEMDGDTCMGQKKIYRVPITWSMYNIAEIEAESLDDAIQQAEDLDIPFQDAEYVEDSFEVGVEGAEYFEFEDSMKSMLTVTIPTDLEPCKIESIIKVRTENE